jgi:hypothetical protein
LVPNGSCPPPQKSAGEREREREIESRNQLIVIYIYYIFHFTAPDLNERREQHLSYRCAGYTCAENN